MKKLLFLLVLFLPLLAFAEPGPDGFYINNDLEQCGYVWAGDEFTEYEPAENGWERLFWIGSWTENICKDIAGFVELKIDMTDETYCSALEMIHGVNNTLDTEMICELIGYEYIGEIDYVSIDTGLYEEDVLEQGYDSSYSYMMIGVFVVIFVVGGVVILKREK